VRLDGAARAERLEEDGHALLGSLERATRQDPVREDLERARGCGAEDGPLSAGVAGGDGFAGAAVADAGGAAACASACIVDVWEEMGDDLPGGRPRGAGGAGNPAQARAARRMPAATWTTRASVSACARATRGRSCAGSA
jgi:hypothetical protein